MLASVAEFLLAGSGIGRLRCRRGHADRRSWSMTPSWLRDEPGPRWVSTTARQEKAMQIRGPVKGTTRARGLAAAAPLPPGTVRRHVLSGAAITALGGLLFGYDTGVISGRAAVHRQGLPRPDVLRQGTADQHPADRSADRCAGGRQDRRPGRPAAHGAGHGGAVRRRGDARCLLAQFRRPGGGPGHHRPGGRLRVDGRAAVHRRARPAADPRRAGQLQPAGHHLRNPGLLPGRLRAGVQPELAADVRAGRDPGGR